MNELLEKLQEEENITTTTNGAVVYGSTQEKVYDLFAQGGAMRQASESNCQLLFIRAYEEDPNLALKCLFYLRDILEGQGERRFFRVCLKWLAMYHPEDAKHILPFVPEFGRWDDLYSFINTPIESLMFAAIAAQAALDMNRQHPSLLAKWLPSENTSSKETRALAKRTRIAMDLTSCQYRKMLSTLRARLRIVETLMSQQRWDEIDFSALPSRAGLLYKNAFLTNPLTKERYEEFIASKETKVHTSTLYPYDIVKQAADLCNRDFYYELKLDVPLDDPNRMAINKYWEQQKDWLDKEPFDALIVADTSGSMTSGGPIRPIDVAISLALYGAERLRGPFKGHFISFSARPRLIETKGVDFCDKVVRIYNQNLCENTNIEATFDLILRTAQKNHLTQENLPKNLIIISDMQFDSARGYYDRVSNTKSLMNGIQRKWKDTGYIMPRLIFWNVNAATGGGNIPLLSKDGVTYVSGASPVIFEMVMQNKTGNQVMREKLLSERYKEINSVEYPET